MHTTVDGVSTTELHTLKWLKWQIFCHIYFATIKKKKKAPPAGTTCSILVSARPSLCFADVE